MSSTSNIAEIIHDKIGTKEKNDIILDVIQKHDLKARVEISKYYERTYGKSLFDEINSEIGGDYGQCASQMFLSPLEFCIHHLKLGLKKGDALAMEQLVSRTPDELLLIEQHYNKNTGEDLKTNIKKAFKGAIGNNIINLWNIKRISNSNPNKNQCEAWATTLQNNKPDDWVENEKIFEEIFIQRSPEELILIARYYLKLTGKNLIDVIDDKAKGKNKDLLREILYNNIMPHEIFTDKIYKSIKGLGTDEETLSRCIVSRCDLDMAAIRDMYFTKYKETLKDAIIGDTSKYYQKLLVYLAEK
jgi:hypothetical protein